MKTYSINIALAFFCFSISTYANQQSCLSGEASKTQLTDQLLKAQNKSEISKAITEKYQLSDPQKTEADAFENCLS